MLARAWMVVSVVLVSLLLIPRTAAAQQPADADAGVVRSAPEGRLRVGVAGDAPFVVREGGEIEGISVDIWQAVAESAGTRYELVAIPTVEAGLDAVARGELDVLVGPISITSSRAERVRFTQPYFHSALGIVARPGAGGMWHRIKPFLSRTFVYGIAGLLGVLLLVGTLVWVVERKRNAAQFPATPTVGIGNGVWFALVTMTTVGYGDRAPVTLAGRIIAGAWMIIAVVSASSLTAGIATALTLASVDDIDLDSADQLARRAVLAVPGTPGLDFAQRMRARVLPTPSVEEGTARILAGEADAMVFDRPMLRHYLREHPELDLVLSRGRYVPQGYGFALPPGTPHVHRINVALLRTAESGRGRQITERWLGVDDDEAR
jgi:polar amino acid transport system substrate-binding protein